MLEIKDISKKFPGFSLKNVSFTVETGDYFILLGESGAGKSMMLETIAGLVRPDSGSIRMNGREITHARIQDRRIGIVFQDHAVFPHLTVGGNIAYALHGSRCPGREKHRKVIAVAEELGISGLLERKPATLSGGELQRVALGRTLIREPEILLLDEPLASLDPQLRTDLRRLLRNIHRAGRTLLHVTHDYEEALSLATRIAVIRQGVIVQEGSPAEVFHHPRSEFVAHFVGVRNFFPAYLSGQEGGNVATTPGGIRFHVGSAGAEGNGFVLIRGEDILLSADPVETSAVNIFPGTVVDMVQQTGGTEVTIGAACELHALITRESVGKLNLRIGSACWAHFKATAVRFIPG